MSLLREKFGFEDMSAYRTKEYLLRLAGEECSELVQAALKYIRSVEGYTNKTREECEESLTEEVADALICIDLLLDSGLVSEQVMNSVYKRKYERLTKRFKTGNYE